MKLFLKAAIVCVVLAGMNSCKDGSDMSLTTSFNAGRTDFQIPAGKAQLVDWIKVHWDTGDKVAVHPDGKSAVLFTASSAGATTTLSSAMGVNGSQFLMVYPYEASKGISDGKILLNIPAVQKAYKNTFDPSATISVACTDNLAEEAVFDNVLSLIHFSIPAHLSGKVHTVIFESRSGEPLCGDILCNPADMSNEMAPSGESHTSVTLKSAPAMTEGGYYLSIRPCTMATGFKITAILYDKTYYTRELTYRYECEDDFIYNVGEVGSAGWYYTSYDYIVSTVSGIGGVRATSSAVVDGESGQTTWRNPDALAWMSDGRIMVADRGSTTKGGYSLRIFDPVTKTTSTWVTSKEIPEINVPWRMSYNGDNLYIANKNNDHIIKVSPSKESTIIDNDFGETNGIQDITFDNNGDMYVLDRDNHVVYKYAGTDGTSKTIFASTVNPMALESMPEGSMLISDYKGHIFIADKYGNLSQFAGNGTFGHYDGLPENLLSAEVGYVYGFARCTDGTIYFSQWEGNQSDNTITSGSNIRMIVPDAYGNYEFASMITLVGNDEPGFADGKGTDAKLKRPYDLIVNSNQDEIYFSDEYNYVIRKIDVVPVTVKVKYEDIN